MAKLYVNDNGTPKLINIEDTGAVKTVNGNTPDSAGNITSEQTGCLPLTGGVLNGTLNFEANNGWNVIQTTKSSDATQLALRNAGSLTGGAGIYLKSADYTDQQGWFKIYAATADNTSILIGKPNGSLNWEGNEIERVRASGSGYVRYASGVQICWGVAALASLASGASKTVTFEAAFSSTPAISTPNVSSVKYDVIGGSTTGFDVKVFEAVSTWNVRWIAVGRWM